MNHDDFTEHAAYRDELAAYALGALEPAEMDAVREHLGECEACRDYLFWLHPATDLLPASVHQHGPKRRLKRSLMGAVREDIRAAKRAERERERAGRGLWGSIWRPVTAAAACLVLVAGAVGGYALRGDEEPVETVQIEAQPVEPGVGARMAATLERHGDRATLHIETLPALPNNRNYQAWIQRDGALEPSTTFVVNRDGSGEVAIDGSLEGAEGVYITREPNGGSDNPTSPVILKAPLS